MSQTIDVNFMRKYEIEGFGLCGLDDVRTFYYDETNNIRRLHVRADGLNVKEIRCFVLGGIVHDGAPKPLPFETHRQALRLQKTTLDLKLEHVARGNILDVLDSPKTTIFLDWLSENGLMAHYFALDPLYWAVIDIMESILAEANQSSLFAIHAELKNDLYELFRHDLDTTVDLFRRYTFPDVGRDRRGAFIAELRDWLDLHEDRLGHMRYYMLKGMLQMAAKMESLPFLEGETPNVLIEQFSDFYIKRFCLFKTSEHIVDAEDRIRDIIDPMVFIDNGRTERNFRFAVSYNEPGIQISDVVVGMIGKLYSFLNSTTLSELLQIRSRLTQRQHENLTLLGALLDRSAKTNVAFAHTVLSLEDGLRQQIFLVD